MKVRLLHNTPLWVCATAIRTCWASEGKSDSYFEKLGDEFEYEEVFVCGKKDKELIERVSNKNKHSSVLRHLNYIFDIQGISTKTLLAFTRHKAGIEFSVQSTRYTTKKRKDDLSYTLTGDLRIDSKLSAISNLVNEAIEEGCSNDDIAMLLPQSYQYTCVVTMNAQAIQHFLKLRTNPSAHFDIRELALNIYASLPSEHKYLFKDSLYKEKQDD